MFENVVAYIEDVTGQDYVYDQKDFELEESAEGFKIRNWNLNIVKPKINDLKIFDSVKVEESKRKIKERAEDNDLFKIIKKLKDVLQSHEQRLLVLEELVPK